MLRGCVKRILNKLCDYFSGLDASTSLEHLWRGSITLEKLILKCEVVEKLHPCFKAKSGSVNHLKICMPWSFFGKKPVEIIISGIEVVLQLQKREEYAAALQANDVLPKNWSMLDLVSCLLSGLAKPLIFEY